MPAYRVAALEVRYLCQLRLAAKQVDPTDKPNREPGLIPADCHADYVSDHMTRASGARLFHLINGCQPRLLMTAGRGFLLRNSIVERIVERIVVDRPASKAVRDCEGMAAAADPDDVSPLHRVFWYSDAPE